MCNPSVVARYLPVISCSLKQLLLGMGKVLPHGADLLVNLPKNYNIYGVNNTDFREFVENNFLKNPLTGGSMSMDRRLEQFNRTSVRMAMLKHEEIFKEQVRELHRLYRVQKMLMIELRNNAAKLHSPTNPSSRTALMGGKCIDTDTQTGFWTTTSPLGTNQIPFGSWNHNNSNQSSSGYNFHSILSTPRADPNLQEQSNTCSRDNSKMPKGFDLEQPAEEISTDISAIHNQVEGTSMRPSKDNANIDSSCNPYFCKDGENEVELTLSIGLGASKKKPKNRNPQRSQELGCSSSNNYESRQLEPSLSVRSDRGEESSDPGNSAGSGSGSATCDRESLQQPPWLLHALSLNRT